MHKASGISNQTSLRLSIISVAVAGVLSSVYPPSEAAGIPVSVRGVVAGSYFTPPSGSTPSSTTASVYQGAKVCFDANDNGVCDAGEISTNTRSDGTFVLSSLNASPIVAEISLGSLNSGHTVVQRSALRVSAAQIAAATVSPLVAANITVTPLTTEVCRMMEDSGTGFQAARQNLADRLGVSVSQVLADPNGIADGGSRARILAESVILTNRFTMAAKMVDRHDVSPAALAVNPSAIAPVIQMKEAQQAAMNIEGIPRYDHIFVIMLENKATSSIKGSAFAPMINAYLNAGNQFTSYYSTGNPSEPNRLAVAAADDFGITDDNSYTCVPAGDAANAVEDLPLPNGVSACTQSTNHNIKNKPNLLTSLSANGMSWRIYSESVNPGRDVRADGVADNSINAPDDTYPAGSPVGAIGNPALVIPFPAGLYKAKHNSSINFQNVRNSPDFLSSNRTMGGGQWDMAIQNSPSLPAGWNVDQFGSDLISGNVGQLNILEPDQCDDMHGITVQGQVPGSSTLVTAGDCGGNAIIYRGDSYTDYTIKKIKASPLWNNPQKRVAIVMMFDEGTATSGFNSCCGWNTSGNAASLGPLVKNSAGNVSAESVANYKQGNKGHGTSIWGVLTNQAAAPKGVVDSDAYSHVSFVRTMQDMFQLADPGDDWSYMNRSKYSEKFIAANILNLPEYAGSADTHFDAVRPMNHAYVIPAGYVQKNGYPTIKQVGPDADQRNGWALK